MISGRNPFAVGAISNRRVIAALEWVERFVYRKADHIVPVTHAFREHILARGGSGERITVIRNGVDLALFTPRDADEDFAKEIRVAGKFVASYVGTHGMAHGLDTILDAADLLRDRDDIAFLLVGDGAERARLEDKVRAMRLSNVLMLAIRN